MEKPKKHTISYYDWDECRLWIEQKLGYNIRDVEFSEGQFDEWCDKKGYGKIDPKGTPRDSSQIWYEEYTQDIKSGNIHERPYRDFWHFLLDADAPKRDGFMYLDPDMYVDGEGEPWQKTILDEFIKEFGKGPYLTEW